MAGDSPKHTPETFGLSVDGDVTKQPVSQDFLGSKSGQSRWFASRSSALGSLRDFIAKGRQP